ncbi:hypothetical protein RSAG8_12909, partial [Rhizoctonia solani AG-8 WAC10335]
MPTNTPCVGRQPTFLTTTSPATSLDTSQSYRAPTSTNRVARAGDRCFLPSTGMVAVFIPAFSCHEFQ